MEKIKEIQPKKSNSFEEERGKIQERINVLEENIRELDQKLEPLTETYDDFVRKIYSAESGFMFLSKKAKEEREKKAEQIKKEMDEHHHITERNSLRSQKQEMLDQIFKLKREIYENSLNELKTEVSSSLDKTYNKLDSLTKEHIEPLKQYGMTDKSAKESLDRVVQYKFDDLEHKIKVLERVQGDIEKYLSDKLMAHDIGRLEEQLNEIAKIQ